MNSMGEWMNEMNENWECYTKDPNVSDIKYLSYHLLNKEHAARCNAISSISVSKNIFLIFRGTSSFYFHGIICGGIRYHGVLLTSRRRDVIHLYMNNETHTFQL